MSSTVPYIDYIDAVRYTIVLYPYIHIDTLKFIQVKTNLFHGRQNADISSKVDRLEDCLTAFLPIQVNQRRSQRIS